MPDAPLPAIAPAFVAWQCRIRQHAVRRGDGRPSPGMRPDIVAMDGVALGQITTVLIKSDPQQDSAHFQQIFHSTRSPLERYEAAMTAFQSDYYQYPELFSDRLTALFAWPSASAEKICQAQPYVLYFEQFGQRFSYQAAIARLALDDHGHVATYWHNALFNPHLPPSICVLALVPDWSSARATPPIPDLSPRRPP